MDRLRIPEFSRKRENAVSTHERLEQDAQAVLDVIENPDVAQALRQDKNQNLQYLKDNYGVSPAVCVFSPTVLQWSL
jgi:translation initiation factor 3 subunit E